MQSPRRLIGLALIVLIAGILIFGPGNKDSDTTTRGQGVAAPVEAPKTVTVASNDKRLADVTFEDVERISHDIIKMCGLSEVKQTSKWSTFAGKLTPAFHIATDLRASTSQRHVARGIRQNRVEN
jgi:hypothetical protein